MESPRKNNDCYFYYYSTCTKGDNCTFRHEPSALGCETMCSYWQQGKCLNQHCNFRHMELRKNRKAIPCYWETQPSGCRKPHCPFLHKNPRDTVSIDHPNVPTEGPSDQKNERSDWSRRQVENSQFEQSSAGEASNNDRNCVRSETRRINQGSNDAATYGTPAVDPLVVNFEEESDNESISTTPIKCSISRTVRIKTLEEIKLEKIQKESAAFYSYSSEDPDDLRQRILTRFKASNMLKEASQSLKTSPLTETRKRKSDRVDEERQSQQTDGVSIENTNTTVGQAGLRSSTKNVMDYQGDAIKIKTLAEIRAERALRQCSNNSSTAEHRQSTPGDSVFTKRKKLKMCPSADKDFKDNNNFSSLPEIFHDSDLLDVQPRVLKNSQTLHTISKVPDLLVNCSNVLVCPDVNTSRDVKSIDDEFQFGCLGVSHEKFESDINAVPAEDILRDIDAFLND